MIRRTCSDSILLITQHHHAMLAGEMARRIGNGKFSPPIPFDDVIQAIARHDSGWPLLDDQPAINSKGLPRHVFESDVAVIPVWERSVENAAAISPYAGLLVSIHVLALSIYAANQPAMATGDRMAVFKTNQFQHGQIERQEEFRRQLKMRTDLPLRVGLAEPGRSPEEDLLRSNFYWLRAMDRLSLDLCFDEPIFEQIEPVYARLGSSPVTLRLTRDASHAIVVDPWPFDAVELDFSIPARRVAGGPFATDEALREAYANATSEQIKVKLAQA
jgi:hypothetical protein